MFVSSSRYSVNVFQPPFLPGRTSPEQPPQPLSSEKPDVLSQPSSTFLEEAFEDVRDSNSAQAPLGPSLGHSLQPEQGESNMQGKTCVDRHSLISTDSGFSEQSSDTLRELESGGEKETTYEKSVKPEGIWDSFSTALIRYTDIKYSILYCSYKLLGYQLCVTPCCDP